MTSDTLGNYRNHDALLPVIIVNTITWFREFWKDNRRYDRRLPNKSTYIEQNLTDPNIGPEIRRTLG